MALYATRKEKWYQAGLWGSIAALVRLPGVIIFIPLAYAALIYWKQKRQSKSWVAVGLPLIAATIFPLYIVLGMDLPPWTPLTVQSGRFHGGIAFLGANIVAAASHIISGIYPLTNALELFFTLLFLILFIPVWRQLPRIYGVYYLTFLILYLSRMGGEYPLLGMTRYVLALFPAFILFGLWGRNPWINRIILYSSWFGLLYFSGQFAIWGWVG